MSSLTELGVSSGTAVFTIWSKASVVTQLVIGVHTVVVCTWFLRCLLVEEYISSCMTAIML